MASESGTVHPDLADSVVGALLRGEPYRFEFFQAVRLLERLFPGSAPVGEFVHPGNEVVHFHAHPSLAFPASQIQALDWAEEQPLRMTVNFMGLTGPQGVLPNAYTSLIMERVRASDTSLRDFLDIFNHRAISLFYRAWRKYRIDAVSSGEGRPEPFFAELLSLLGLGTEGLQHRQAIEDDAFIYYSGLLAQKPRSAQAFRQILADYFDVPVEIKQFSGSWYKLDADTQCSFSDEMRDSEVLGSGVVIGDAVWNQQFKAQIVLGPLTLERYLDFLPNGRCWEPLRAWARFFSNEELDFEVKLILKRELVPACELGAEGTSAPQLGWVTWVKSAPFERDAEDTVLDLDVDTMKWGRM